MGIIRLRRPSPEQLAAIALDAHDGALTYDEVGGTLAGAAPSGFHHIATQVELGRGADIFDAASEALRGWAPQRGSGLVVAEGAALVEGSVVALAAPIPVGFVLVVCRIVAVIDQPSRFGFAYGTLGRHPESGEELFVIERSEDDTVRFRIEAFSRPHSILVRLAGPIGRRMQAKATQDYLDAMCRAIGG
ncbi:MAG TPA: DUF1990 domain-containing protein [Acidimicrobiales bacterium]|nr:DUF1990 domain-containing protein [Acidimicrobiales bacterium]